MADAATIDIDKLENNPLLDTEGLPRFAEISPDHVVPALREVLRRANERLEEVEQNAGPGWDAIVPPLEKIDRMFERAWGPVGHLFGVANSPELRDAREEVLPEVVTFNLRCSQSEPIYQALKAIVDGPVWTTLDEAQQRIVSRFVSNAELSGIGLQGEQRERFNEIAQQLAQLSTNFGNNVLDANKAWAMVLTREEEVERLPPTQLQLAAASYNQSVQESDHQGANGDQFPEEEKPVATPESGPWRITLDVPSMLPFMQHSRRSDLREKLYRAFVARASEGDLDNTGTISEILSLRREQAELLGYQNFADVSLERKMAPDTQAVFDMEEELRAASWGPAQQDLKDIQQLARESGETGPIELWDAGFWAERLREQRFDYKDEDLRPYFPLERVLDGLFALLNRLFGIRIEQATEDISLWDNDARYFRVYNESDEEIAGFYLDPYSRPKNKQGGAWMDTCFSRCRVDGKLQLPVAQMVCNSTPPVPGKPSLMSFREVETLFHEFGHGLQHMLTTIDYADASGISGVEWDAVELPSQFMENWCYHKPTLLGMAKHYETGETLPEELFEKIVAARTYRAGSNMLRQIQLGLTDMRLHTDYDPQGDQSVFDVQRAVAEKTAVLPLLPEDHSLCSFSHIFAGGYAAGYYSYKWAEVLSADAFEAFEEAGLDNDEAVKMTGRRFRDTILALGGSRHPMEIFREFRGREPSTGALLRHTGLA